MTDFKSGEGRSKSDPGLRGWVLVFALLNVLAAAPAFAQEAGQCDELLTEADAMYVDGQYQLAIRLVDDCLRYVGLDDETLVEAYRLLALSYIRLDRLGDARMAVLHLLNEVPEYTSDPVIDPPNYTVLVESVRSQFEQEDSEIERSWLSRNVRWVIGGGTALAGTLLAAILMGGSGGGGPSGGGELPPPPGPPN